MIKLCIMLKGVNKAVNKGDSTVKLFFKLPSKGQIKTKGMVCQLWLVGLGLDFSTQKPMLTGLGGLIYWRKYMKMVGWPSHISKMAFDYWKKKIDKNWNGYINFKSPILLSSSTREREERKKGKQINKFTQSTVIVRFGQKLQSLQSNPTSATTKLINYFQQC